MLFSMRYPRSCLEMNADVCFANPALVWGGAGEGKLRDTAARPSAQHAIWPSIRTVRLLLPDGCMMNPSNTTSGLKCLKARIS